MPNYTNETFFFFLFDLLWTQKNSHKPQTPKRLPPSKALGSLSLRKRKSRERERGLERPRKRARTRTREQREIQSSPQHTQP